jgi:predicted RNase H-like HicB family nuclease
MSLYFFHQLEEKSKWLPALASERENLIRTKHPALVSVLDVDHSFDSDLSAEDIRALKYSGPAYFDFDAENVDEATEQFKVFLLKLKAKDVNLDMLKIHITGKKGYHIEIPPAMFMGKVPTVGVPHLPSIYREMAHSLFVDTLDLRVYSASRGRMWRCPNVKREDNGKYKVQISADEALNITPGQYAEICTNPRPPLALEPPSLNSELGLIFAQSRDKVEKAVAKQRTKKAGTDQLKKYEGQWPKTFEGILHGVTIKPGVGWNNISMQLAITASALGMTEEKLLTDATGVLENHEGDASRYNTPSKRRRDLRDMFRYVSGNPCYEFSVGGVLSLLIPEVRANADIAMGEWVPDQPAHDQQAPGQAPADGATKSEPPLEVSDALRISNKGIFAKSDDGYKNICELGLQNPIIMGPTTGEFLGYELTVNCDREKPVKRFLSMGHLASRAQLNSWALDMGAAMRGTDQHVGLLVDLLRKTKTGRVFTVEREGVDLVTPPTARSTNDDDIVWAAVDGVQCLREGISYRFHGIHSPEGFFKSDLMHADDLSLNDEGMINDLLSINTDRNLAKLIGWFSAAFLTQLIRKKFRRFPSLQVYGQAGAGKSMTMILLNHLHYSMREPKQLAVAGQTQFPIIVAVATSASIPVVFEEVKRRQLNKHTLDFLQNILRSNYTADQLSRGGLTRDRAAKEMTVTDFQNGAPVAFVGEALEDQSAILERCVVVAMTKVDKEGRKEPFERCLAEAEKMGRIGKSLAIAAITMDRDWLNDTVNAHYKHVTSLVAKRLADDASRPAFNLAVVLTGLEFMRRTIGRVFGTRFDERFEELTNSILDNVMDSIPSNMSEASRVLDTLAHLSRNEDDAVVLLNGRDYFLKEERIEIKLRNVFERYVRYQRSLGLEVLFDSYNAFQTAMLNYGGMTERSCPNSPLYDSPRAVVVEFSLPYLDQENVNSFKE